MKDFEMLTDFIDGKLPPVTEGRLFSKMAYNPELRGSLKQFLAIGQFTNISAKELIPSHVSSQQLFQKLGFTYDKKISFIKKIHVLYTNLIWYFNLYRSQVFTGVATSMATAIFILFLLQPFNVPNNLSGQNIISKNIIKNGNVVKPSVNDNFFGNASPGKYNQTLKNHSPKSVLLSFKDDIGLNKEESLSQKQDYLNYSTGTHDQPSTIDSMTNTIEEPLTEVSVMELIISEEANNWMINENNTFSLEVGGSIGWRKMEGRILQIPNSVIVNPSIKLFHKFLTNFYSGIYFEQSSIVKQMDLKGVSVKEIYSEYLEGGFCIRYKMDKIIGIKPLGQLSFGLSSNGWTNKILFGLEYELRDDFAIILGMELSNLFYNNTNGQSSASKLGLNYSLAYYF